MLGKIDASLNQKLQAVEWGEFKLGDLFDVVSPKKRFDANKVVIYESGKYPYIVRTKNNNGQKGFLDENTEYLNDGNTLSFGQDTATVFYQKNPFFTGDKIKVLKPKTTNFNKYNALFFLTSIRISFKNFSWGKSSFNETVVKNQCIHLPVKNGNIDYSFMKSFIREFKKRNLLELEISRNKVFDTYLKVCGFSGFDLTDKELEAINHFHNLKDSDWGLFKIGNLFERISTKKLPYKAKDLPKQPIDDYLLPCLTSSFQNQGLNYYVPLTQATVLHNVISIPSNSDVYRAYYQPRNFTILSDAYAIRWKFDAHKLSSNEYLFMVMCINKVTDLPIYSYKNKLGGWNVVKNKYIRLPTHNGEIDFHFMELFISALRKLIINDIAIHNNQIITATKNVVFNE